MTRPDLLFDGHSPKSVWTSPRSGPSYSRRRHRVALAVGRSVVGVIVDLDQGDDRAGRPVLHHEVMIFCEKLFRSAGETFRQNWRGIGGGLPSPPARECGERTDALDHREHGELTIREKALRDWRSEQLVHCVTPRSARRGRRTGAAPDAFISSSRPGAPRRCP